MPSVTQPVPARPAVDPDAALLGDPGVFATTVLVWAVDRIGPGVLTEDWEPETVRAECRDALGRDMSPAAFDRLMAARAVITSDAFSASVPDFVELCNVLAGSEFDPTRFDPADPDECAWGVTEAALLAPPTDGEPFLSDDVLAYIGRTLSEYGYLTAPARLADADRFLETDRGRAAAGASDDPGVFEAVWQGRRDKAAATDANVADAARRLFEQLRALHLKTGNTEHLVARLGRELGGGKGST